VGTFIKDFLEKNMVGINYVHPMEEHKTSIALAMLDENEDATYSFYHNYPNKRLQGNFPEVKENDIVLFGSYFSISPETRKGLLTFMKQARKAGAIIIYDPNFRHPHLYDLEKLRPNIEENIQLADIVRGSHEDFQLIFNTENANDIFDKIREFGNPKLVYTQSNKEVVFISDEIQFNKPVPKLKTVSTIGAGDNFNAGLIYSIFRQGLSRKDVLQLKRERWQELIQAGIKFGSHVCQSMDNYISMEFAKEIK
jgi:fructokinase